MSFSAAFYEAFEEEELQLRKFLPSGHEYFFTWKTIQEEHDAGEPPAAPIISTRTQSRIPDSWAEKLEGIITRSTGYDHIADYLSRNSAKIASAYLPDYAARAVAEHAMMLWTCLLRKLPVQSKAFESFHRDGLTGREVRGRSVAVIGVGRIGSQIVDIAAGLGMDFVGVDIVENPELKRIYGLRYLPLPEAIARSEIIACALPLTRLTRGMLGGHALSAAPKGAIFVNVGRGEVSPARDLLELVEKGILSGAGLDVYNCEKELAAVLRDGLDPAGLEGESAGEVRALLEMKKNPSFILTPHNAFNTEESVLRKSQRTAENLGSFLKTGTFITPIRP